MKDEVKATPRPWKRSTKTWDTDTIQTIVGPEGKEVAQEPTEFHAYTSGAFVSPDGIPANLDLIVRAVNAHDDLLAAVKAALVTIQQLYDADAVPSLLQYGVDEAKHRLELAINAARVTTTGEGDLDDRRQGCSN